MWRVKQTWLNPTGRKVTPLWDNNNPFFKMLWNIFTCQKLSLLVFAFQIEITLVSYVGNHNKYLYLQNTTEKYSRNRTWKVKVVARKNMPEESVDAKERVRQKFSLAHSSLSTLFSCAFFLANTFRSHVFLLVSTFVIHFFS